MFVDSLKTQHQISHVEVALHPTFQSRRSSVVSMCLTIHEGNSIVNCWRVAFAWVTCEESGHKESRSVSVRVYRKRGGVKDRDQSLAEAYELDCLSLSFCGWDNLLLCLLNSGCVSLRSVGLSPVLKDASMRLSRSMFCGTAEANMFTVCGVG